MTLVLIFALAAALSYLALWLALRARLGQHFLDHATARSLHRGATPRIGWIGITLGTLGALLVLANPAQLRWSAEFLAWICAVLAVFLVSLFDDLRRLSAGVRLTAHLVSASLLAISWQLPWAVLPLVAILLVWGTNLFNFMDGSDGLAGGMAAFGFGALSLAAGSAGHLSLAAISAALAGSAIGFLPMNWYPARLFLGDAGSIPLGFLAGAIGVQGVLVGAWSMWFPLCVFFPFLFDASLTLIRRILRRENLARAHREHLYQRAVLAGLGHRGVALSAYVLMLLSATSALVGLQYSTGIQVAILSGIVSIHCVLWLRLEARLASRPLE